MRATVRRNHRSIGDERIVDARVGNQVGLELVEVDVESTVEAQAGGDRANDLGDETVEVLVAWAGDVKVATADIVDGFVVNKEGTVGVLDSAVGGEDSVVRFNNSGGNTGGGVNRKLQL